MGKGGAAFTSATAKGGPVQSLQHMGPGTEALSSSPVT